jgi:transcription initiation protein SPT3
MEYSECRQASFTYKKSKRFREWANLQNYIEMKANDDIVEILGFLSWEMVRRITETALVVQLEMDKCDRMQLRFQKENSRKTNEGLFATPREQRPIEPIHIHEVVRRLQIDSPPLCVFKGGRVTKRVHLL